MDAIISWSSYAVNVPVPQYAYSLVDSKMSQHYLYFMNVYTDTKIEGLIENSRNSIWNDSYKLWQFFSNLWYNVTLHLHVVLL